MTPWHRALHKRTTERCGVAAWQLACSRCCGSKAWHKTVAGVAPSAARICQAGRPWRWQLGTKYPVLHAKWTPNISYWFQSCTGCPGLGTGSLSVAGLLVSQSRASEEAVQNVAGAVSASEPCVQLLDAVGAQAATDGDGLPSSTPAAAADTAGGLSALPEDAAPAATAQGDGGVPSAAPRLLIPVLSPSSAPFLLGSPLPTGERGRVSPTWLRSKDRSVRVCVRARVRLCVSVLARVANGLDFQDAARSSRFRALLRSYERQ
jgi:hypothetical protein